MELVPLKIRIENGLRNGKKQMIYPDFNKLSVNIRNNMDWSFYIDTFGKGMMYDKVDNLGTGEEEEYACVLINQAFAEAAVNKFPDDCSIIDEAEFEDFYDNRHAVKSEEEILDVEVLQGLLARIQLEEKLVDAGDMPPPSDRIKQLRKEMLDPNNTVKRGIRKNTNRFWATYKAAHGITIANAFVKVDGMPPKIFRRNIR